ncbi:hypothetical protein HanIR_Chr13g0638031 [Helianthus annuus]|nr:hypothetical protein HanIR_Chr13g0638031 [Helianthus annuus]
MIGEDHRILRPSFSRSVMLVPVLLFNKEDDANRSSPEPPVIRIGVLPVSCRISACLYSWILPALTRTLLTRNRNAINVDSQDEEIKLG